VKEITIGTSTGLLSFFKSGEKITLLRLRNPWGAKEWNGPFSDGSPEWTKISKHEKEKLGLTFEDDGEFWMPYDDFVSEFSDLSICRLVNTSFFTFKKKWHENCVRGQWTIPNQAGGCPNHESFLKNPQYYFDVPENDMELLVQLLQTDLRGKQEPTGPNHGVEYKSIGFHVMQVEQNRRYRVHKAKKKAITSDYVRTRGVFYRGTLNKGRYVIVPTTFEPNVETEFYLRMYTEANVTLKELKEDFPEPTWLCKMCCQSPIAVSIVHVEGVHGLHKPTDTYCIVKAERESLQSSVVSNSSDPIYNLHGILFRYDITKPLIVEIWERRLLRDTFLGCAYVSGSADNETQTTKSPLVGKGQKMEEKHPGELRITVTTYDEPDAA
jgi:calpain-5